MGVNMLHLPILVIPNVFRDPLFRGGGASFGFDQPSSFSSFVIPAKAGTPLFSSGAALEVQRVPRFRGGDEDGLDSRAVAACGLARENGR